MHGAGIHRDAFLHAGHSHIIHTYLSTCVSIVVSSLVSASYMCEYKIHCQTRNCCILMQVSHQDFINKHHLVLLASVNV